MQTFIRLAGAAISFAALAACSTATGAPPRDSAPLVVELFTSQGCSSCPPADALLAELAHDGALAGRKLAPLSFHVDYWDELGRVDAIWEAETHTEVAKGENAGHALASVRVVRRLERVAASGHAGHVEIGLDRRWRDVGAVAFAQRPDLGIVGATELPRL